MKGIAILVDGGGDTAQQKAELRNGFDGLLSAPKQAARDRRLQWKLVPAGSRGDAYRAFTNALGKQLDGTLCVLLVDSEGPLPAEKVGMPVLSAQDRKLHLEKRDHWDLSEVDPEQIHLMVQCMEAWIVADLEALAEFYGQGFRKQDLPLRQDLEEEPKAEILDKLARATRQTSKGEYSAKRGAKIRYAGKLLKLIDGEKVALRCPRFSTFNDWLLGKIAAV